MTGLDTFLHREAVMIECCADSKKQLLEMIGTKAEKILGLSANDVRRVLTERERLGSTGLGNGIAIPHGKLPELTGVLGLFIRLTKPVEFDAVDDKPVDIICVLLAPESSGSEHLKALPRMARALRNDEITSRIRATNDVNEIYTALLSEEQSQAA